ncbi:hypothetical protein Tco_0994857 [Tanacetum coccineum]
MGSALEFGAEEELIDHFHGSVVRNCDVCQRNKSDLSAYPGVLQPLPIPDRICEDLLATTPLKLLELKMVKHNNRLVVFGLIQWSNGNEEDATWEKLEDIVVRFPEFVLDP